MLFNSLIFLFAFLPITYMIFWILRSAQARYIWLTITGYVFYSYWDPRFCLLMLFSTIVSFWAGIGILKHGENPRCRAIFLGSAVTVDLLLLGFFKYAGFVANSINVTMTWLGLGISIPIIEIVLPVGISFYTFHTISYMVDAYRGQITPTRNYFEFSAYVSLFSQLVAGPIVRFRQIEKDLISIASADRQKGLSIGISFFIFGLIEKVLIADSLANFVDPAFTEPAQLTMGAAWLVVLGYSSQLYFDFCGYSTMAVGLGLMFGLNIPVNFSSPYKALNPSDFWQRWHISLSTCMRDYLYISIGGNRKGELTMYRNLLLTMLIGGLWHGAAWTFVAWGLYHGLLLIAYRRFSERWNMLPRVVRQWGMFLLVVLGWIPFRSPTFESTWEMLASMGSGEATMHGVSPFFVVLVVISIVWAMYGPNVFDFHRKFQLSRIRSACNAVAFGVCLAMIVGSRSSPFLYFQF